MNPYYLYLPHNLTERINELQFNLPFYSQIQQNELFLRRHTRDDENEIGPLSES